MAAIRRPTIAQIYRLFLAACFVMGSMSVQGTLVVNSIEDIAAPPAGQVTLRSALTAAGDGESIIFDAALDGQTITLSIVDEEHTILKGEVMGITNAPSGPISYLVGYFERDYGRSALYAHKDLVIDASDLPSGITVAWGGGDADPARVLAVYGNLTLKNVSITGGRSISDAATEPAGGHEQSSTRARGGGLAVWGIARLENCRIYDNACVAAVMDPSRDAGLFGGGIYADIVQISDSIISGNSVTAAGVSGGGVFTVGGAEATPSVSTIERSAITGNAIFGIFAYGAGVYSDGGGIGKLKKLELLNCTIADNLVDLYAGAPFLYGSGYWRGGGVYMSNGYLSIQSCTIVENEVHGVVRTNELGKVNLAGGIAATVGNAHAVESMTIGHSIIAGNTVHESSGTVYNHDIFTGSLFQFTSTGYNRFGVIDFSQMLVPLGKSTWYSLCRKHYPKQGDQDGLNLNEVLALPYGKTYSDDILSAGASAPGPAVLHYIPNAGAIDQIAPGTYFLNRVYAEYESFSSDNFLAILLGRLEDHYGLANFAATFTADFENFLAQVDLDEETADNQPYTDPYGRPILTLTDTHWFGPAETWPSKLYNYPYIEFWHRLDQALLAENILGLGPEVLSDDAWQALFEDGLLNENPNIDFSIWTSTQSAALEPLDQIQAERSANGLGDIGAIEYIPPENLVLKMDGMTDEGSDALLHWSSTPGTNYSLWASSNLASNDWALVESGITSSVPFNLYSAEASEQHQFFKINME